ncbi:MAG: carboxypeptidase-like regulatory domain-containing protein [Planctomycetota bacterium]
MVRDLLRRPSTIVVVWTFAVVAVFVASGELRLGAKTVEPAPAVPLARRDEPVVVRQPAPPRAPATMLRKGRVFDELGFLVVGAEIVPMQRPPVRSDGDGSFLLEIEPEAPADVLVRAEDKRPVWVRAWQGSPDALVVQLVPSAPWDQSPAPLPPVPALRGEGTVRTGDGRPLAGAYVTAVGSDLWARTDDLGRFVLPLPTPSALLLVHDPDGGTGRNGFLGQSEVVSERARGALPLPDLVATPALAIRGIVRDATGAPVASVPVEVAGAGLCRVTETGAGGEFHVGGLAPGPYDVRPFAFRGAVGKSSQITIADASVDVDLQLQAAGEVRVRVVDERGDPVAGVFVAASVSGTRRGIAQADPQGFAAVPVSQATEFDVRQADGYAPLAVRRFDSEPATIVVTLP